MERPVLWTLTAMAANTQRRTPPRPAITPAAGWTILLAILLGTAAGARAADAPQTPPAIAKSARAPTSDKAPGAAPSTGQHHWHSGSERRALRLDRALQADFSLARPEKSAVLRASGSPLKDVPAALQSPVFRDESGRPRALPGGVIVLFDAPLPEDAARATIERHGARIARRIGERTWLLASDPGMAALELANRLHATGAFAAAEPNWWIERTKK
jgi:hypothetical protein